MNSPYTLTSPKRQLHPIQKILFAIDWTLLLLLLLLCGFGLVVLYSASGGSLPMVQKQAVRMLIGVVAMLLIAQLDPNLIKRFGWLPYLGGLFLLALVPFFGFEAKGAQRWINIAGVGFQPSEIMKLAVPLAVAIYISNQPIPIRFGVLMLSLLILVIPVGLVLNQPDLGTSLLIIVSGVFVIFLAGLSWRWLLAVAVAVAAMMPIMWFFVMREYQKQRILTLFDPEKDPLGAGWNIIQSTTAIGSGGLYGKGYMEGTQSQLSFLPESHTDFIIAVLAEELGFIGVVVLLGLYLLIIGRCLALSANAKTVFARLLAGSLTLTFFIYIFVNVGMVSGLLPVVGVPLPMMSYGGTAMVTLMAGFGLIMAVTKQRR